MTDQAIELLMQLIATPSVSRKEDAASDIAESFLQRHGINTLRYGNNIVARSLRFDASRQTLLLNSHIDTVHPSASYTFDPYHPFIRDGRLYGLGSNDAGASLVALMAVFILFYKDETLPFNLLLGISAEEEVSGENGIRRLLPSLAADGIPAIDMAIVGEPTSLRPAVAERGLMVLDGVTRGIAGHAARDEGINAIYRAMSDIEKVVNHRFDRTSSSLGPIKISVTQISAGSQHNVVPDECRWVADVRTTDAYTNTETAAILQDAVSEFTTLTPRSTRLNASVISSGHPLVRAAAAMGLKPFVSPTLSDRALMHGIPALKIGPGDSARSHTADEYVFLSDITQGIDTYSTLLLKLSETIRKQ